MSQPGLKGRKLLLTILFAGVASCVTGTGADAHPHVWATVRSEIVFGPDNKIAAIRHAWTFDELYTSMAVQGLDADGDGVYSKEELVPLAQVNVESLQEFDYFTYLHVGNDDTLLPLKPPTDYWVEYDNSVLTLHFTLPLERPLDPRPKKVLVDVYDPSFFVAFGFATNSPVKMSGSPAPGCNAATDKPDPESQEDAKALSEAFFSQLGPNSDYGSQFAQTVTVQCSAP